MSTLLHETSTTELERLVALSTAAAEVAAETPDTVRAAWLEAAADRLDENARELVPLADEESHLGTPRLTGELARTTAQLRLFAAVLREGSYLEATIDHADAAAVPPHGDLRRLLVPLGPVAVFAASNFPFAFSVAGGDTASALAVGCSAVVKAHPGHPRLSRRIADLVSAALDAQGAPAGLLTLIEGQDAGIALVEHPDIAAVGFTGSVTGGRALFDRAVRRSVPIPFYGELGSVNPVVVTPSAAASRGRELAEGLAGSFTMGAGQFCTKPGVVFVPAESAEAFRRDLAAAVPSLEAPLLTESIRTGFPAGSRLSPPTPGWTSCPAILRSRPSPTRRRRWSSRPTWRRSCSAPTSCSKSASGRSRCWCATVTAPSCWPVSPPSRGASREPSTPTPERSSTISWPPFARRRAVSSSPVGRPGWR
ncbi:hypothetical protein GCM10025867_45210 [Frondihabitans sucicola]|uniref:Aldehyde dehydrogenase domain-containing protein n=1 Tax=Frondihabitans sucicola TaxID=1268041 RepID=A0ABM8GHH5_9MICO|nr:hypothetical protein GCM10025867_00480 [Frondihabitans sucicola]BDZ52280.1 hypothetical protein GCM10025867_45210 [Frondihabitans sucicola]